MDYEKFLGKPLDIVKKHFDNDKEYSIRETKGNKEVENLEPRVIRIKKTNIETEILVGYFKTPHYKYNK